MGIGVDRKRGEESWDWVEVAEGGGDLREVLVVEED